MMLLFGFVGRTPKSWAKALTGGVVLGVFVYVVALFAFGGIELAYVTGGLPYRRRAAFAVGVLCGIYYGIAFTRARGGPMANLLLVMALPFGIPFFVTFVAGLRFPQFVVYRSYLDLFLVGTVPTATVAGVIIVWEKFWLTEEEFEEWAREYYPLGLWNKRNDQDS